MKKLLNVCIIDDDDIHLYTIKRALKEIAIPQEISTFSDGEEAINFIKDNSDNSDALPDLILLDINMPIMDGFDFIEAFVELKIKKDIIIHMVSSSVNPNDIKRAKDIPQITEYITKPISPKVLEQLIKNAA
ncbi:response regulator [Aurantibacter sp.]|uniref:response regulator n=1 Tax=Aurantibacter sp. TaxID=2807103 RepID=UPI0032666A59